MSAIIIQWAPPTSGSFQPVKIMLCNQMISQWARMNRTLGYNIADLKSKYSSYRLP